MRPDLHPLPSIRRPLVYRPPDTRLWIVHRDSALLIVEKPSGLLTVPGKTDDLADCLAARVRAIHPGAVPVHRLDLETSGLVIFARTSDALRKVGRQFERREIAKRYVARVAGSVMGEEGSIDLPLRSDWPNRPRQMVCFERGREAITGWQVLKRENSATRLALAPRTGRSHQLRVHLASIGHPILGDPFYAGEAAFVAADRLQLHAEALALRHPVSGNTIRFDSPAPF